MVTAIIYVVSFIICCVFFIVGCKLGYREGYKDGRDRELLDRDDDEAIDAARSVFEIIKVNVNNDKLSNKDFREFINKVFKF